MQPVVVMLLAAWTGGIILGVAIGGIIWLLLGLVGLLAVVRSCRVSTVTAVALLAVAVLGFAHGDVARRPDSVAACSSTGQLRGRIVARPDVRENSVRYLVEDSRSCRYFVYAQRWPVYERDTAVTLSDGRYQDQAIVGTGEPDFGRYLTRHGVAGVWSYPRLGLVSRAESDQHYQAVLRRIHTLFVEPDASLIGAMMFAERGQLSSELTEYFRRTSLTHILSISGTHISLLTGMIFTLVRLLPLKPVIRTLLVIFLLWGYVWFIGAPVSAVRAGFFWSVTLLALRLGLLVSLPTAIILTLTLMLTWQPLMVLDVGLQLSFMAVVGIFLALFITKPWRNRLPQAGSALGSAMIVSLGATVLTWPLISLYFATISFSAVLANLLIIPAVLVIMSGSVVVIGVSHLSNLAGHLFALPVHAAVIWMTTVAHVVGSLPGSYLAFTISVWGLIIYYVCVGALLLATLRWQGRTWREVWE